MHLPRYNYGRRRSLFTPLLYVGCGASLLGLCAAVVVVALLVLPNPQGFALQVMGFRSAGQTEALFAEQTARPAPVLAQPAPVSQIVLNIPQVGQQAIAADGQRIQAATGLDPQTSQTVLQAQTNEAGLLALCQQYSNLCAEGNGQVRGVRFDLRPNGLIVLGEVLIPGLNTWQPIGIVFQQVGRRLGVVGVDVNGLLLVDPPAPYNALIGEAEQAVNALIGTLSASVDGTAYSVQEIFLDHDLLTLILR